MFAGDFTPRCLDREQMRVKECILVAFFVVMVFDRFCLVDLSTNVCRTPLVGAHQSGRVCDVGPFATWANVL